MGKGLCIFGMIGAGLLLLVFGLDLAAGLPFGRVSVIMDVGLIVAAAGLLAASVMTFREIP
jgi:hypothetical protein